MADYYTSSFLRRLEKRKGKPWCGVLKYQVSNPDFMPDPRPENQRRKSFGKRPNAEYVEDPREARQKSPTISKQVTKVFDTEATREIMGDPDAEAPRTKSAASAVLATWHRQKEAEHNTPDASLTTEAFIEQYISGLEVFYDPESTGTTNHSGISPTTAFDYRGTMRYLRRGKAISDIQVRKLTVAIIETWEMSLAQDGLAGTTISKAHRLLSSALEYAVTHDVLEKNPARGVRGPRRTSDDRPNALDLEQRAKAIKILDFTSLTPLTIAAQLALYLGLRRGEVCALTWENVDLEGVSWPKTKVTSPKVRICQSVGEAPGGTYIKPPKSKAGRRILSLEGGIMEVLKRWQALQREKWVAAMAEAEIEPTEDAFKKLYICGSLDGRYYHPQTLTHEWGAFSKQFDLIGTEGRRVSFHGLRDTYAITFLWAGGDPATLSNNLGHSDVALTLRKYGSALDSLAMAAGNKRVASDLDAARTGDVLPFIPKTGTEG